MNQLEDYLNQSYWWSWRQRLNHHIGQEGGYYKKYKQTDMKKAKTADLEQNLMVKMKQATCEREVCGTCFKINASNQIFKMGKEYIKKKFRPKEVEDCGWNFMMIYLIIEKR